MSNQLKIIDKEEQLPELIEYLTGKEYLSYDCETTGVHKGAEVIGFSIAGEDNIAFYVILKGWNDDLKDLKPFIPFEKAKHIIEILQSKQLIMHNAVFDCHMAESFFKTRYASFSQVKVMY